MATTLTDEQVYEEAKKRVKAKKDFLYHLSAWVLVNIILLIIWATVGDRHEVWFVFPLGIWGVFVVLHGLNVFVFGRKSDLSAIEKEAEKIKKEQG
jgi:hypothetical protein